MKRYSKFDRNRLIKSVGHSSCHMLDAEQGCVGDCAAGISVYSASDFCEPQVHPYQEGFYVIEGSGEALVGEERFPIEAGMSFLVPRKTRHSIRACADEVRLFWFHCT